MIIIPSHKQQLTNLMGNPDDDGKKRDDETIDPYGRTHLAIPVQGGDPDQYLEEPVPARTANTGEVFEGVSGAMRAREEVREVAAPIDTIAARLLEAVRPVRLSDVPGAKMLARLQVDRVNMWPMSNKWKVIHVSFPDADTAKLQEMIRIVQGTNGEIISLPFQDPDQVEFLAVFPNKHRAEKALYLLKEEYGEDLGTGMQGDGNVYCGIVEGAPCFIDKGVDEAFADSAEPHMPMVDREDNSFAGEVREGDIREWIMQISPDITKVGAIMEIRMPNYLLELGQEERSRFLFELFGIIDRKTDMLEWLGNTLRIVSTRERAAAMLIVQVKEILKKFPQADLQVAVAEGPLEVVSLGEEDTPPRTLRGKMFEEARELAIPEGARGVFVSPAELVRLSTPRGLRIEETRRTEYGTIELVDVEDRTTEIKTGGPRYMVGRFDEIKSFIEKAVAVGGRGGVLITVLDGDPGIGKSRFMEECEKVLRNRRITDKIVCAKANEYERERPHTFARRVVGRMVDMYNGASDSENYAVLTHFAKGERGDDELAPKVAILHDHSEELVRRMRELVQSSRDVFTLFLDDLQWCDSQSAVVIAVFIGTLANDDKMILELSARSDYQEMPLEIKRALRAKNADEVHLRALPFVFKGEPTDLLRNYVLESPQFLAASDKTLPESFLVNVGTLSSGNPYMLTRILYDLESDGKICVDENGRIIIRESEINYDDYEAVALYANRVSRLNRDEQMVCKALILFGGSVSMNVFKRIFPELTPYAHKLEEHGLVCTEPDVRFQHDLMRKAAEEKFKTDPRLAWEIYVKLQPLSENAEFAGEITHTMLFGIVKQRMANMGRMGTPAKEAVHKAALCSGVGALTEAETAHRMTEALEIIRFLTSNVENIDDGLRFTFAEAMARISLRLGDPGACVMHVKTAQGIASGSMEMNDEWERFLDLHILECDARYLQNLHSWKKYAAEMKSAIDNLGAAVGRASGRQGLTPVDNLKITRGRYMVRLNEARYAYCMGEMGDALHMCSGLIDEMEKLRGGMGNGELPAEYERVLIEAKRFYIALIMQREEWDLSKYDDDVRFSQVSTARQDDLKRAYEMQRSVYDVYTRSPHLMRHPKDLVTTLLTAAKLEIFMGGSKDNAMDVLHEAARRASGFQEVRLLTSVHQMRGDLCMSYPDARTRMSRMDEAVQWYKVGMAEMRQLGKEGERDPFYAYNACNCARALAIQAESLGRKDPKKQVAIREGFGYACEALDVLGDQNAVKQYVFPTIGRLLGLAGQTGMQSEIAMPESVTRESVQEAVSILESSSLEAETAGMQQCVLDELAWKLSGLKTLLDSFSVQ